MKLFKFERDGETEVVASQSQEEAISFYAETSSSTIEEIKTECEIKEIPRSEWKNFHYVDDLGYKMGTFNSMMKGLTDPTIIASTNC